MSCTCSTVDENIQDTLDDERGMVSEETPYRWACYGTDRTDQIRTSVPRLLPILELGKPAKHPMTLGHRPKAARQGFVWDRPPITATQRNTIAGRHARFLDEKKERNRLYDTPPKPPWSLMCQDDVTDLALI